jgi:hypothetical protein
VPSWEEIKKVLDSPYVSQEKKTRLMEAYDKDTFNFNDEEEKYAKKYVEGYSDRWGNNYDPSEDGVDDAFSEARADMDRGAAEGKAEDDAKNKARTDLEAQQAPAPGGVGVRTSDEVLDLAKPTLDFLSQWIDKAWNKRPGNPGTLDHKKDVWDKFHENRGIDFQQFLTDADDLSKAHKVIDDTMQKASTELGILFGDWTGRGATAAKVKWEESIQPDTKELQAQVSGASTMIPQTVTAVYNTVKHKVDEALTLHRTQVAHATLDMAEKVLRIARKETDDFDEIIQVAGWIDGVCGSNLSERLQNDDCCMNDENRNYAYDICAQWSAGSFTPEFQGYLNAFNNLCKNANDTIDQQWGALSKFMGEYKNDFTDTAKPATNTRPPRYNSPPSTGQPPGSSQPSGSTPPAATAPPVTTPPATTPPATTPPATEGSNPTTGKPPETDPDTGQAYPIDPRTGEAIKDGGDDRDTMTVQKGDHKLAMTEPDRAGKMGISVDDGSGHPKDFKLDFGDEQASPVGAGGRDGGFGPQGAPAAPGPGDKVYQPGPDGKIHIEDGGLKITAERPEGPGGPTVVTVDDGSVEPTKYTLDGDGKPGGPHGAGSEPGDPHGAGAEPGGPHGAGSEPGDPKGAGPAHAGPESDVPKPGDVGRPDVSTMLYPAAGAPAPGTIAPEAAGHAGAEGAATGGVGGGTGHVGAAAEPTSTAGPAGQEGATTDATQPAASGGSGGVAGTGGGGFGGAADAVSGVSGDSAPLGAGAQSGADMPQPVAASAGIAVAPGGGVDPAAAQHGMGAGAPAGMGGMGGAGNGGGGGGNQERGSSQYRIDGGIFETSSAANRISGSLDDEEERSIRYDR